MENKNSIESGVETASEKQVLTKCRPPWRRLALSVLAGLCALLLFWSGYILLYPPATAEMAGYAGRYSAVYAGSSKAALDLSGSDSAAVIELEANGACRIIISQYSYSGRWKLNGSSFSARFGFTRLKGRLDGERLSIKNDSSGVELSFIRDGAQEKTLDTIPAGIYTLTAVYDGLQEYTADMLTDAGYYGQYIRINSGGSGEALLFTGKPESIRIDDGQLIFSKLRLCCTLDGTYLMVDYPGGLTLTFEKQAQ